MAVAWVMLRAWRLESARLWAVAWSVMSAATVMTFWMAVYWNSVAVAWASAYWREFATMQLQSRPTLQLQLPQSQSDDFLCVGAQLASSQLHLSADLDSHRMPVEPTVSQSASRVVSGESCNILVTSPKTDEQVSPARPQLVFLRIDYKPLVAPRPEITADIAYENHTQNRTTPTDFI